MNNPQIQTRFITRAVFNGTELRLAIPGKSVNSVMSKLRRMKEVKNASLFMFYERKTDKITDVRFN